MLPALELISVAALLMQDATIQLQADAEPVWSSGSWQVYSYPDEDMCDIGFPTESGEYVTIGYSPKNKTANLLVTNRYATSLKTGDRRKLQVFFGNSPAQPALVEHTLLFEVVKLGEQRAFSAAETYPSFLRDFASHSVMSVMAPTGKAVAAIQLKGSAEAVKQLRQCALQAAEMDPRDPFS
ncbi:MAG: hypothetical protein EON59_02875 [Alphaproteobacteria bacterium]|nr:MAG: hypothetical protein EON59_02875 [Alphaproteobacteria bacterium]